jgi:hypothetical protein
MMMMIQELYEHEAVALAEGHIDQHQRRNSKNSCTRDTQTAFPWYQAK